MNGRFLLLFSADPPSKPDVTLSCINSTCFNVQWTDLSESFLISRYEVSLSNGEMKTVTDSETDVSFCFNENAAIFDITSVTVVAFDNADREGESTVVEIPHDMDIDSDSELHFFAYTPYFCIVLIIFVFLLFSWLAGSSL